MMINKIGLYAKPSNQAMAAVNQGAEALGLRSLFRNPGPFGSDQIEDKLFDLVVVVGLAQKNGLVKDLYMERGIHSLVLESAHILRPHYMQFGIGKLNWLPDKAPPDRAKEMGLTVEMSRTKKNKDGYILVCGQKPGDAQHNIDVDRWRDDTISVIREYTDRKIVFRPHPQVSKPKKSIVSAVEGAYCMVTHNSTAAYEALLRGVPVFCDLPAVYYDFCQIDLSEINAAKAASKAKRQSLFDRVAYAQWTLDEIATGEPMRFLLKHLPS